MTLPLLDGDSVLRSTTPLESASYVDITLDCLRQHGIVIEKEQDGFYRIPATNTIGPGLTSSKAIIRKPLSGFRQAAWVGPSAVRACGRSLPRVTKSSSPSSATWVAKLKARRN